jgi:hypothetical protein
MNRYIMMDGVKSVDFPQYPNSAWNFHGGPDEPEKQEDFYASVAAVFRAVNLTASATANIPFALVTKGGQDYDVSDTWENKVGFMPNPGELIRLWRMSLTMTNSAYGFMENIKGQGQNLRYIVPQTIRPIVDIEGLKGFKRTLGTTTTEYTIGKKCPIIWMWRMDHTTELLPAVATEFRAMMAAAGVLYYADYFVESFFKRGGIKPTMLVLKGMATPNDIEKIEGIWDKVVRGYYKYLGKIFQGVDPRGGLEAQTIGEGVDTLKDQNLMNGKIADVAMSIGMPLSIMLANSANKATAITEYKGWYENSLDPWCHFIAECATERLFKPLGLRMEFRPEMTDTGQEEEVARAGAYSTYVTAGMLPSIAAQVVGIELPQGVEYDDLDEMAAEKLEAAQEAMINQSSSDEQSSTDNDNEDEIVPTKFTPNLDQLHELELWRKFAFRKLKKGETLDFPFEVKMLPNDVAVSIRAALSIVNTEDGIKEAFNVEHPMLIDLNTTDEPGVKSDIMQLAEAINKAAEIVNA